MPYHVNFGKYSPCVAVFCCSLFFSYIAHLGDAYINHDAVFYMDAAKAFVREGLTESFNVFPWPFFSILVAFVHMATGLDYELSANAINSLFAAGVCVLFVKIYSEITDRKGSLWIAVILILALEGINKYREDIMRDFGYWFFFLAAFLSFLNFYKKPRWLTAILWQICSLAAFLFRNEAVAFIFLGPWAILYKDGLLRVRIFYICRLFCVYLLGLLIVGLSMLFVDAALLEIPIGRLPLILKYINYENFFEAFNGGVEKMGAIFWYDGLDLKKYYSTLAIILVCTMVVYLSIKTILCLTIPYSAVLAYGIKKKYIEINSNNRIVIYFTILLAVTLYLYMIQFPVITPRYTTSLVLMLLLLVAQIVERTLSQIKGANNRKKILVLSVIVLLVQTAATLISLSGDPKAYIRSAGVWVKENMDQTVAVYSNYIQALYYTDRGRSAEHVLSIEEINNSIRSGKFTSSEIIIFVSRSKKKAEQEQLAEFNRLIGAGKLKQIQVFEGEGGNLAVIYNVSVESKYHSRPVLPPVSHIAAGS